MEPLDTIDQDKDALRHCYEVPTTPLNQLKAEIDSYQQHACPSAAALCQYCGINHDATDFDHYLPKDLFAEFSTLALNLVPCCSRCNNLKHGAWLDENGTRMIVSFYFDVLPDSQFLFADLEMGIVPIATFRLSDDPADFGGLEATIRNHFRELDLLNRFKRAAPDQFAEVMPEIAGVVEYEGIRSAAELLANKAIRLATSHSPNYWKVALFQAMSLNDEFIGACSA
jgi:hypothetical protein